VQQAVLWYLWSGHDRDFGKNHQILKPLLVAAMALKLGRIQRGYYRRFLKRRSTPVKYPINQKPRSIYVSPSQLPASQPITFWNNREYFSSPWLMMLASAIAIITGVWLYDLRAYPSTQNVPEQPYIYAANVTDHEVLAGLFVESNYSIPLTIVYMLEIYPPKMFELAQDAEPEPETLKPKLSD
jgi:hypothetical protein